MELNKNIPSNWEWVKIEDISQKSQYGFTTKAVDEGKTYLLRTTDITNGPVNWDDVPHCRDNPEDIDKYRLEEGDILISRAGSVGESYLVQNLPYDNVVFASYLIRFKPKINSKFFKYFLNSPAYWNAITEEKSGIAVPNVNATKLNAIKFPLPPPEVQHRIVEKIEELFSDLDNGIQNLKKAKQQLETYKQSVLKAAFEGKLTKEWREQQNDLPTPEELKQHIEKEQERYRQQQLKEWEQEVKEWKKQGKPGKKPRKPMKGRTFDPLKEELESLPELPSNWDWIRISDIVSRVEYGTSQKSEDSGEVPVLRMGNMQEGKFVWDDLVYSNDPEEIEKYLLEPGDVLFNRTNSPELVGKTALYKGKQKAIFAGYLIRLNQIDTIVDARYLNYYLNSYEAQNYGNKVKTDGVNQSNINGTKLSGYPFPYTSLKEQKKIADKIEFRLSIVDQNKRTIVQELQKAEALRQSILKKAFEGKLIGKIVKKEVYQEKLKRYYKNTATDLHARILAKIIEAHHENEKYLKNLNHVKCEKNIHMIESHLGVDLQRKPIQDAAGPDDYPRLMKVEHRARMKNWFQPDKTLGGEAGYGYRPKKSFKYAIAELKKIEKLPLKRIDEIINIFLPMDKERAEVVATLYAAWNNFLINSYQPTDKEIIKAAREEWSKEKLKIKRSNFDKALEWMKKKKLIPAGFGKTVKEK